jgi:hypothetical protein
MERVSVNILALDFPEVAMEIVMPRVLGFRGKRGKYK